MDKEVVKEWWDFVLGSFDGIADAWVSFFTGAQDIIMYAGFMLVWFFIAFSSPVWVGPFLLWRKLYKGQASR